MSPYRTPGREDAAHTPTPAQRLLFFLSRDEAHQRWPWARERTGGRWTPVVRSAGGGVTVRVWQPVLHCPLTWPTYPERDNRNLFLLVGADHNATIADHRASVDEFGRCACEVYPARSTT